LVGLSLFKDRIGADVKSQMVTNVYLPQSTHSLKRLDCLPEPLSSTGLVVCFTERTTIILDVLQLNGKEKAQSFLSNGPDDPSYQDLRMAASTMTIVNDFAKRGIAMTQQYNMPLPKNEEQKQLLLRIVNPHRKTYPSCSKATLMKITEDSA